MTLDVAPGTPDRAAVRALVSALRAAPLAAEAGVGRVCGGRVAVVWFDAASLASHSAVLEPFELDDAAAGEARAASFIASVAGAGG